VGRSRERPGRFAVRSVLLLSALLLTVSCARDPDDGQPSDMAREQLFFVSEQPDELLVALVLQRHRQPPGVVIEAKAFVAWQGRWRTPFWERVEADRWPGRRPGKAIELWQEHRGGEALRLSWEEQGDRLEVGVRSRSAALEFEASGLAELGEGRDPHGPVAWRGGPAVARIDGKEVAGLLVVEELKRAEQPWPTFGVFEMCLVRAMGGTLLLGRQQPGGLDGQMLVLSGADDVDVDVFRVQPLDSRVDPETGFGLPSRWRLGTSTHLERQGGQAGRGSRPDGGPAIYDVSYARGVEIPVEALIFHLQDGPSSAEAAK
jgi:hypothetical protein